jgi:iron complex transport system permease protein
MVEDPTNLQVSEAGDPPQSTVSTVSDLFAVDDDMDEELARAADRTFGAKVPLKVKVAIPAVLVAILLGSFMLGRYAIDPVQLVQTVWYSITDPSLITDANAQTALFRLRMPRILVVMLVGAALSAAGASYQGMFKNPLVSPDLLGASAGASLGACLALLLSLSNVYIQLFAFIGGMTAVGMAVWLNKMVKSDPTLGLVLGGILVATLFQSGTSLVKLTADANDKLPIITFWLMGSFASVKLYDLAVCIIPITVGFSILLSQSWKLNVLSFGDEEARAMGVNTHVTRMLVIFAATLVTSTSVAIAGVVGWVGLVIPHLARAIVGPNYRVLLPTSMFIGAAYLLVIDNIARLAFPVEIPIGILTAILGVPFFVVIFKRNMGGWR